jgi:hypothetical protein
LLLSGSPKVKRPSTSTVLGTYLTDRLEDQGWKTEKLALKASLRYDAGQKDLLDAVDQAGLVILSFPLYNDCLPVWVIKALQVIASHVQNLSRPPGFRFAAIVNNGFPEAFQCLPALAICRQFAAQCGIAWAGSLAMGAGEALSSGIPFNEKKGLPPVKHVIRALDCSGAALAQGESIPPEAVKLISQNPIPFTPFAGWRWMFMQVAGRRWEREAAGHGVGQAQLLAKPYSSR